MTSKASLGISLKSCKIKTNKTHKLIKKFLETFVIILLYLRCDVVINFVKREPQFKIKTLKMEIVIERRTMASFKNTIPYEIETRHQL